MNLYFRPTDYNSDTDCEIIARWHNNSMLRRLWLPHKADADILSAVTAAQIRSENSRSLSPSLYVDELALLGDRVIGQITVTINPSNRKSNGRCVAWPSFIIGEDSMRGRGLVRRFGDRIIRASKELGATHLEAGVFEFNTPTRRLLEKAGFQEFARVENTTWWDGKSWAGLRYELDLDFIIEENYIHS